MKSFESQIVVPVIIISLIAGGLGGALYNKVYPDASTDKIPDRVVEETVYVEESEVIDAIEKVSPAVMSIIATKDLEIYRQDPFGFFFENDPFLRQFGFPFEQQEQQPNQQEPEVRRQQVSGGTGFIIKPDGFAITNKHVVNDPQADYSAVLRDGKEYDVEVISRDPLNDLAVIQLHEKVSDNDKKRRTGDKKDFGKKPDKMPSVTFGDSDAVKVGQRVLAIGNARGEYENTVTAGIISATGREIQASDGSGQFQETLSGLIQTDAAINFGNSGGPLINLAGQVIGVNTAIDAGANGIGFAIPINEVKPVIQSVEKYGKIVRPILGVRHIVLNKEKAEQVGLKGVEYGALLVGDRSKGEFAVVPDSPADKAGLRVDDVILEVDGKKITEETPLQGIVRMHSPGDKLKLKVLRSDKTFDVTVTLDEAKE